MCEIQADPSCRMVLSNKFFAPRSLSTLDGYSTLTRRRHFENIGILFQCFTLLQKVILYDKQSLQSVNM